MEEGQDDYTSTKDLGGQAEDLISKLKSKEGARFEARKDDLIQLTKHDSKEESLYKMYEMVKHVNWSLGHLLKREDGLHKLLK